MLDLSLLHLSEPWYIYVSMPIISAVIGYVTKLVAIEMIFRPVEFVGIKPFLGWQGMVPRRAAKMAAIAVDSVMSKVIQPEELFDRIDADDLAAELGAWVCNRFFGCRGESAQFVDFTGVEPLAGSDGGRRAFIVMADPGALPAGPRSPQVVASFAVAV